MRYLGCTQEACECEVENILGVVQRAIKGRYVGGVGGDHFKGFVRDIRVANQGHCINGIEGVSNNSRSLFGLREWPINNAIVGVQPLKSAVGCCVANQGHCRGGTMNCFSGKAFLSNKRTRRIVWQLN